jgi:plasmid stability protein
MKRDVQVIAGKVVVRPKPEGAIARLRKRCGRHPHNAERDLGNL